MDMTCCDIECTVIGETQTQSGIDLMAVFSFFLFFCAHLSNALVISSQHPPYYTDPR